MTTGAFHRCRRAQQQQPSHHVQVFNSHSSKHNGTKTIVSPTLVINTSTSFYYRSWTKSPRISTEILLLESKQWWRSIMETNFGFDCCFLWFVGYRIQYWKMKSASSILNALLDWAVYCTIVVDSSKAMEKKRESQYDVAAAAVDICLFNSRNMFTLLLLFLCLLLQSVRSWGGGGGIEKARSWDAADDVFKNSHSRRDLGCDFALGGLLSLESSTGGQGENQHILSLRWRAIATAAGDEAALLRAAYSSIASIDREFTTYSETDSSTLWLISS